MKRIFGTFIHVLLLISMTVTLYASLATLACTIPFLRWLPGYDPDPLGWGFLVALWVWPAVGLLAILALSLKALLRLSWMTELVPLAYLILWAFFGWLGDRLHLLPQAENLVLAIHLLTVIAVSIILGTLCVRFLRKTRNSQPATPPYSEPATRSP